MSKNSKNISHVLLMIETNFIGKETNTLRIKIMFRPILKLTMRIQITSCEW